MPDLVVEVLSPSNTIEELARKRREYFEAGTRLLWEIEWELRLIYVCTAADTFTTLTCTETLDGGMVLTGFALPLAEFFAELDDDA